MIEVGNLSARENDVRVDGITFSALAGETVCVLASDEARRVLLADCLTGCHAYTGLVAIGGIDLCAQPVEAKRQLGYAPDLPALYPDMTASTALRFIAEARDLPRRDRARLISRALALTDMTAFADTRVGTLSLSNRRRLNIAQAILHDPELLVCDCPTGGLDPRETVRMRDLLRELADARALVLLTCSMSDALASDRVVALDEGHVCYAGALSGLYNPRLADFCRKTTGDWFDPEAFREERA